MEASYLLLLDLIEEKEVESLNWGYVDGGFTYQELVKLSEELIKKQNLTEDSEDLVEELIDQTLIFEFNDLFRSRFAETIRLLVKLRQLFPGNSWIASPKLVSDFRVDVRKRRYPIRDYDPNDVVTDNQSLFSNNSHRNIYWRALTGFEGFKLSGFQVRSLKRLLSASGLESGTIITAGTGSGKTISFYLPALILISELVKSGEFWTKTLAVYPRNELLKDQLSEAYSQARKLDESLLNERPIIIGALFGATPRDSTPIAIERARWVKKGSDYICPWLKCPKCSSDLIWKLTDISNLREMLICSKLSCENTLPQNTIILTRSRLIKECPDILFTTTEMLNQRISDISYQRLFGIKQSIAKSPKLLLLDEVHTYSGVSGAQNALVLQRWRNLVSSNISWVGLSATLKEADRFFSELVGLKKDRVLEITPLDSELIEEGAEYQVVMKGDPTLQASLLSTSIQSAMLLARVMDPKSVDKTNSVAGQKIFIFTDDLDVTNRFFDNLRDAEAYTIFGKPDIKRLPLSALRGKSSAVDKMRDLEGQRWSLCEQIGRELDVRLVVGRTTSEDTGVLSSADVVVATAALEVGYNDDSVGLVLQHKAPKSMASFIQRKGRAGRRRGMRPFVVTVLSEYGRDKVAYQAYEYLFDPILPSQSLPTKNNHVLKMQATYAFIDWLSLELEKTGLKFGWMWEILSFPSDHNKIVVKKINELLRFLNQGNAEITSSLKNHLQGSLNISPSEVDSLLWGPPRSLMLEVIPTLARRLFFNWELAFPTQHRSNDFFRQYHPLPDFIPRALFSELNLPEVQIQVPAATVNHEESDRSMPILSAITQFAPGRVSRRYAVERGNLNHWFPIHLDSPKYQLSIDNYARENEYLGVYSGQDSVGNSFQFHVYRPWKIELETISQNEVSPTSISIPEWLSGFEVQGDAITIPISNKYSWGGVISDIKFYLHKFRGSVLVRRFTHKANAVIRQNQSERLIEVNYRDANEMDAAIGYETEVDGFYLDLTLPQASLLTISNDSPELQFSSRLSYLRYKFLSDPHVDKSVNLLQRDWIFQIFICSTIEYAESNSCLLNVAAKSILKNNPVNNFLHVLDSIFELGLNEADSTENDVSDREFTSSRLKEKLSYSIERNDVIDSLMRISDEIGTPDNSGYTSWLRDTISETVAQVILQACVSSVPLHASSDSLIADIQLIDHEKNVRVWITETSVGGSGVIEAFADLYSSEPKEFLRALETALTPGDMEISSVGLRQFLDLITSDLIIEDNFRNLCNSKNHNDREKCRLGLNKLLDSRGLHVGRALGISIASRLIKPSKSVELCHFLHKIIGEWDAYESKFGLALGVREFSYLASKNEKVKNALIEIVDLDGFTINSGSGEVIRILESILWPRGIEVRQKSLDFYNPFRKKRLIDPKLVRYLISEKNIPKIYLIELDWVEKITLALSDVGVAQLLADKYSEKEVRRAIIQLIVTPVSVGYLQFFPNVDSFDRNEKYLSVTFSIRESL